MIEKIETGWEKEPEEFIAPRRQRQPVGRLMLFALLAGAIIIGWRFLGPKHSLAEVGWISDWEQAMQQSLNDRKPRLVLFTADWCPACKQFASEVLRDPQVRKQLTDNFIPVVVDLSGSAGPNSDRARKAHVEAIPTLIAYDESGQESARTHNLPKDSFLTWLHRQSTPPEPRS